MSLHLRLVLTVYLTIVTSGNAVSDFPPFDWFHSLNSNKEQKKLEHSKGQESENFHFGTYNKENGKEQHSFPFFSKEDNGQEVQEINFGSKPYHHKGQEVEEINFGQKPDHHRGQEIEEFNFGQKIDHNKGQEIEEINFESKPDHDKGQEIEEINFGSKPDHHKEQEVEEINFGQKPDHHRGQEIEEFNFGQKIDHNKGQEIEEINFGSKPDHDKGQEIEEINFGQKPDHHRGQEIEEFNFGSKPDHDKGQEIEEINFGSKPDHHKGQEVEEFNFGQKPDHHRGQEIEEFNFGQKIDHNKGQEIEEINFGSKPAHDKGQEIEEINFGQKPDHQRGQEIEEFNFGSKSDHNKGKEIEEINFGSKPDHHKEQEVEEINFGQKPDHHRGQEIEEINFGSKHDHHKGQEVEEFNFGQKPDHHRGQEIEEFNFGQKIDHNKGQEIEEINFGSKPDHHKGQKLEEINFEPKLEDPKRQEVKEINFESKPYQHEVQEAEGTNFEHNHPMGQEIEEINFRPAADHHKGQDFEEFHFDHGREPESEGITHGCRSKPNIPSNSVLRCESSRICELTCQHGFKFSSNTAKIEFVCVGDEWVSFSVIIPECNPICEPTCQNNGICIAPNQCSCPKNFDGAICQFEHQPCVNHPPVSQNSYVNCNSSNCVVKCFDNYSFPDGSTTADLECLHGKWTWTRTDWDDLSECKPSCQPPCINGGSCLDYNKCQCPRKYAGPQCQYELAACDAKKLNFNGYYTCRGENEKVTCTLSCPEGHESDLPLAEEYVCHYSTGQFFPEPVPKCHFGENVEVIKFASSSHTIHGGFNGFKSNQTPHYPVSTSKAECSSWRKSHFKNFDGQVFSFNGGCSYILAEDAVGNTFRIVIENVKCESTCSRSLKIYYEDQEYALRYNGKNPVLTVNEVLMQVPNQFTGISIEKKADEILASLLDIDVTVTLNSEDRISVNVNHNMINKTVGLCGNFNDDPNDDFYTPDGSPAWNLEIFLQSWMDDMYNCESTPDAKNNCGDNISVDYCNKIFADVHFEKCVSAGKFDVYKEACEWDMCQCGKSCACKTIAEFIRNCKNYLISEEFPDTTANWRQIGDCSLECPLGKVYSYCGPSFQQTCGFLGVNDGLAKYSECLEGCFCPDGLIQFNDTCIEKEYCPCKWRNKYYKKGETIAKDCNTCTCQDGEWVCSNLKCSSRCSVVGNSHYRTFDGKRYDLTSQCAYYLLKSESCTIESENVPCKENFLNEIFHGYVSKYSYCTKVVTVRYKTDEIKLKKNKEVLLNGAEVSLLPFEVNGVIVRLTSLFVIVKLPDDIEIWWDGSNTVYVDLPGSYTKPTEGLCGTSNNNQKDDFKTSEGGIEQTAAHFAETWKTDETCNEVTDPIKQDPCDSNPNSKMIAEKYCSKLKGNVFKDCHPYVDVEPFYKNCLYDLCSCQKEIKYCFCPIFSDYVSECIRQNIQLHWRSEIRECGLHCPQGQIYVTDGDSCSRSCQDVSIMKGHCDRKYAEGCGCPDGLVLSSSGRCIPVVQCPCFHQNFKYKPNHELIVEGESGHQFCTCQNALWSCRPATPLELARDYENSDLKCNEKAHEEYTTCKPAEPKTCKNMHQKPKHSTRICFPGCVCKKGFVWDSIGEKCVNASECPCHHGGRSYSDGEKIHQDCNVCTCENGKWGCTERECASVCSTWGDSHFKTFDGKIYDFQGSCDFVLSSGVISEYETFFISLQIVPCGTTGISCPKSVTLKVGSPQKEEKVVFKKSDKFSTPRGLKRILIRDVGLFVFAEVFDLGLTVQWDRGTRVSVKADSRWKNKVKGLCGNFNNDELDDFKTPSSGETSEISSVLFADSWRLQSYCPESNSITDACARRSHRKAWAVRKCSILRSEIFEPCHSEVPLEPYFERCVIDTCGCDEGGDCDCMCTAVAAYAQECTLRSVPIKWRTQEFCPLQCQEHLTYNPCVSACPPKSCDNQFQHSALLRTCSEESCVEGCDIHHCPPGHVLANSSSDFCIPVTSCKTACLTVNNVTYLEGDLMESDDCHSCYCSHHTQVCTGQPCHEVTSTSPSLTTIAGCPEGQIWDDCIVRCNHVCNHLKHKLSIELHCSNENDCISGCRAIDLNCSSGMFLRDVHTCVHQKDCPCKSPSGVFIKPGDLVQESECEKCQCVNNEFECNNVCTTPHPTPTALPVYNYTQTRHKHTPGWDFSQQGNVTLIYHSTVSPAAVCPNGHYESLIDRFTRFSASSHLDETTSAIFSQMSANGSWVAGTNNADQYLQVSFGGVETVHAVNVAGASGNYVTTYHLLYSLNGDKFLDIINQDGKKELFGGPFDGRHSVKQVLRIPIEARYIRFHPTSWHGQISMKVDVLGCKDFTLTTAHPTASVPSICNRPIGIGQNHFPKLQIIVSSSKPNNGPQFIGFGNENGWQPLTNSKFEYVQLNFGDYGNFTGITTKGVSQGNELSSLMEESWVERFRIEYSHDGLSWNPILDEFGEEMTFMGNTDSETEKKNFFKRPIHAKSLKILPVKWHKNIALRLDILGCYKPTHFELEVTPPVAVPIPECNVCSGAVVVDEQCKCKEEEWWDGENCISRSECPCFVGLIAYPVGSTFTTENCEECTCRLFGLPHCTPKLCPGCPSGLQSILTPLCGCTCKPCEGNTRLCPTSNICLEESSWCDGIQDCPDDELNCTTPAPKVIPTFSPCLASCPPGYEVVYRNLTAGPTEADDMLQTHAVKSVKSKKSLKTYRRSKKVKKLQKLTECPPYDCVPVKDTECPTPECPSDYSILYKKHTENLEGSCPLYACEPIPEFANCTVSSKNIKTFDENHYKYEICDHVLVTHDSGLWNVTMVRNCSYASACTRTLLINHGAHLLELHSQNSLVKVDSFPYSGDQIELLNSKMAEFSLNIIGNSIIFTSNAYGFQVIYDTSGHFKITVPGYLKGHLLGLCGLYNGQPTDDKTRPDGKLSKTTVDFGDSWFNPGGKECIETVCPIEIQKTALDACLKLKEKPFNLCPQQLNTELCIESTCECLMRTKTADECRCQLLSDFAAKCKNPNLLGWRVEHDCPSSCAPNLVHFDCYPYACQPTCGNDECAEPATNCYSGCFCPDGLVKRGDQCIKVSECRDCVCSGMGDSTYLTFDGGLTFNGNCSYVATREKNPSGPPRFEVLISNRLCNGSDFMTCTEKVEVGVPGHSIQIIALPGTSELVKVLVDEVREDLQSVEKLDSGWAKVSFNPEASAVDLRLPQEHVDVRYFYRRFAFTIKLPSHLYSGNVEGLCGACSQKAAESEEINDPEVWQTDKDENCMIEPPTACIPTAEHQKLCFFINSTEIFGQCLAFVDPAPFIDQCLAAMCMNGHFCNHLEAYGQACRDAGVCVDWRSPNFCPFSCPSDLEYQACNNGCLKTCDNYDDIDNVCTGTLVEGCFCHNGQILIDGICKSEKYCEYCDLEGHHYEGDLWHVDACTNCTCRNHVVTCEKIECLAVDITCDEDQIIIKEENESECCPKYRCDCKHRDECPEIKMPNELLPGMEAIVNESGCCSKVEIVCRKENCPEPEPCRLHYIQRMINTTNCCPDYICEKPENICFYEFTETRSGIEKRVERGLKEAVKEVGERWTDGACKTCVCVEKNGFAEAVCTVTECLHLKDHHDFKDYLLEETFHPEKCCPEIIRKSCKHNGLIYGVGDSWVPDEKNPCETMKCNDWGGGVITKETRLEVCNTECESGWEYELSVGRCCGHCVQKGCLVEDKIYKEGEIWYSDDKCSKSVCELKHGHFSVIVETKSCQSVEDCPREDIYRDGCCFKCRMRTEDKRNCFPQLLPPEATVEIIKQRIGRHGKCYNAHPIQNFTRCAGNCDSFTVYNAESWSHESVCKCCKPEEYSLIEVELKCEDGKELKKKVTTPSRCSCMSCGG